MIRLPPSYSFPLLLILGLLPGPATQAQSTASNSGAWSAAATWNTPPVNGNSVVLAGNYTVSFGAEDVYTGGTNNGTGLVVGNSTGTGTLNITGGTLSSGAMQAGNGSTATINQSGGTLNIGGQQVLFGQTTNATLNVTGGTMNMTGGANFHIGHGAQSFLNISNTGVVNMTGWIRLLNNSRINVNGGSLNRNSGEEIVVENSSINQTAGMTTIANYALWLGFNGVTGTLNLSGGTFKQYGSIRMGALASGNGIVHQTGGTYEMGGDFEEWGSAPSAYHLNGGTFRITVADASINSNGAGMSFNINGSSGSVTLATGTHNFSVTNSSVFNNAAAALTKTGTGAFTFGGSSQLQIVHGALAMEAGTLETAGGLVLGIGGTASGTMSGGTLRTGYLGGANLVLGQSGSASFDLSGGTIDVGSRANILFGFGTGSSGALTQTGGTFSASSNTIHVGYSGGTGTVNLNSGTFSAHNLAVGGHGAAAGTLNLNGGTFSVSNNFTVGTNGTVNVNTGGSLRAGGANNMTVENGGTVKFNGGGGTNTMNIYLGNNGTVDINGKNIASGTWANLLANGVGATLKNSSTTLATISANNTLWLWTGGTNLTIDTGGGDIQINSRITSSGMPVPTGIIKSGTNALVLTSGDNDYTGNTVINEGTLELSQTGSLRFQIGADGVNNTLKGLGRAVLDGAFHFFLGNASTDLGARWVVVEPSLNVTYGPNFRIAGFKATGGTWSGVVNGIGYVFEQSTGTLSVSAASPTRFAAMAAGGQLRWIWHQEPGFPVSTEAPLGKVRLRRGFDLAAGSMPRWADFTFAVDDSAELFINGQRIGFFSGWNPPTVLDIRPWLQPGRNVIAVEANNSVLPHGGFVGLIELDGMSPVSFDAETKSAPANGTVTDWTNPAFDDTAWSAAALLASADHGPWGRVSGPAPGNPTMQAVPDNFPTFTVPGFEVEMDRMRQILFGHYRFDLSKLPAFSVQWLAPAAIWAGLDTRPQDSWTRSSLRARLLSMREMNDGYVSSHQHEGLGHSEGWPFPFYTQSGGAGWIFSTGAGLPYGPESGVNPVANVTDWTFRRANVTSLDVTGGLRLELTGDDAAMTSPEINIDPQVATWVRIKLIPGTTPLQPYVQWRTAANNFSNARKVAIAIPAGASPGVPVDLDVPIHPLALGGGNITRVRFGFGNIGPGDVTILRIFTAVDTRHNVNNANFVLAAATYFNWTGDVDFLRDSIGTLRRIFRYAVTEFGVRTHGVVSTPWAGKDGRSGLTIGAGGQKTINYGHGVGNNYWDLLPFGGMDAYATIYHFAATQAMEQLEAAVASHPEWNIPAPAAGYGAASLAADLEQMRSAYAQTFWKADKGRFGAAVDSSGKLWDYGFTFLNNEAMYYGLTAPTQERQIVDWLSGARTIPGETATGSDLYRWRFGPRATTVRNIDYYNYAWTGPETLPFGGQVQDGGAVFGFSFHDLMGRLRVNGPDDAWARLKEILAWYGEVQTEGGYRNYYRPETAATRGNLQGGGTAGGLGIDAEFHETLLVPLIMTEGFLGLSVTPERIRFAPQLPQEWPSLEIGRIQYRDWMLHAKATPYAFELELETSGTARPMEVELGAGRWDVRVLDAQNQVLGTAAAGATEGTTIVIHDPASTRLVATRAAELNPWLPASSGDWNNAANWHLGVVPGGTHVPLFNNGGTAYLATNAPAVTAAALVGQGAGDGTLEIRNGGSLALGQLLLGRDNGRTGTLVIQGGTLAVAEVLEVGNGGDGTGGHGNVQLQSGLLNAGTASVRLGGNGNSGVTGSFVLSGGTFQATNLMVRAGSSFTDRGGTIEVTATITNHGTWIFNPPGSLVRSYHLASTGGLTKTGTGTMTLTGTTSGTGGILVESGRLVIDGNHSAATGDVIVRSGAVFGGHGILGGNLVLESGARWVLNPPSALTVTGLVSGGFSLAQVEGLEVGLVPGRYPLIHGTVDPSQFSPMGAAAAQVIDGGNLAWFEAAGDSLDLVVASATPGFSGWLHQHGLQGLAADPLAAPAGDGIANLLKYAFNLDPLRHEGAGQYPGEYRGLPYLEPAASGHLDLIYYRDSAKTDIRVTPVWRRDLDDPLGWTEVDGNNRQLLGTQGSIEQWRARLPMEGARGFMNIQVEPD